MSETPRTDAFVKEQLPHLHSEAAICAAYTDFAKGLERDLRAAREAPDVEKLIEELDALEAKATPGPWEADHAHDYTNGSNSRAIYGRPTEYTVLEVVETPPGSVGECINEADQKFIVALRNAWPALRAALKGEKR